MGRSNVSNGWTNYFSMNRIPLFHSDIFTVSEVGDSTQVSDLLLQIKKEKAITPATVMTNDGCWRSSKQWNEINWLLEKVFQLAVNAQEYYRAIDSVFDLPKEQFKIEMWTNVNSPGSRNVLHNHKKANFSVVYYLQSEDTGNLRLINPANMLADCNTAGPFTRDFSFRPKNKDLILWPAWVPHEVETNLSTNDRINIVFDIYTNT